jgi:hypothetical protein
MGMDDSGEGKENMVHKDYLTYDEPSNRISYAVQTLRNYVHEGIFKLGKHYFKPTGKVLFFWPAIEKWLRGEG